jgi:hypothetical protein
MPCQAWQCNSGVEIARIFHMRVDVAGILPMVAHDTYLRGRGRMQGTVFGLVSVVDASGPEFDVSELVTWLNDAVLLAPSMLLRPNVTWSGAGAGAFDLRLTDAGHEVTARVFVDDDGAPTDFRTTDRWAALPSGLVQAPWHTPIDGWDVVDGRPFPGRAAAVWHLDEGPFTYAEARFDPGSVEYDVVL